MLANKQSAASQGKALDFNGRNEQEFIFMFKAADKFFMYEIKGIGFIEFEADSYITPSTEGFRISSAQNTGKAIMHFKKV